MSVGEVRTLTGTLLMHSPTSWLSSRVVLLRPETTLRNTASSVRQKVWSVSPQPSSITVFSVTPVLAASWRSRDDGLRPNG